MGKNLTADQIKNAFPLLANDPDFKVTSPYDEKYNCISWAMRYTDRWTSPPAGSPYLDGVLWWPPTATEGAKITCLVDAFEKEGFVLCDSYDFDKDWLKVALYYNPMTGEWTHAARQLRSGMWSSKLGKANDIEHGTPYSIEGQFYGKVFCIMQTPFHGK